MKGLLVIHNESDVIVSGGIMKAKIRITLKPGILDPEGKAIMNALHTLGYKEVEDVRQGKYIEIKLNPKSGKNIEELLKEMCDRVLSNPVIENYSFEIEE